MFLTLEAFLDHFPQINISREDFVKKFIVTYAGNPTLEDLFNLKAKRVIKTEEDRRYINREKIIDYFYHIVVTDRFKYLTCFYHSYFELENPYKLNWDYLPILTEGDNIDSDYDNFHSGKISFDQLLSHKINSISMQKNDASRRIIRNLNYLDILHNTKITNSVKCKTSFWQTFDNLYNHLILEDRLFTPACIDKCLEEKISALGKTIDPINYNNLYYHIQQYQPKASILNPYTINWILKNVFSNSKTLFTPVLSWSSYMNAFLHTDYTHYVGVDVMKPVCERTEFLFEYYKNKLGEAKNKSIDIYCQPSETLLRNEKFLDKYNKFFDAVLMCPPYYNMEIYPSGQPIYSSYEDWLSTYWENTVLLIKKVLAKGGKFGFIINDYKTLKDVEYPLITDLNTIASKYFKLVNMYSLVNRGSPLRVNFKNRTEMLFIYE